VFAEVIVCVSNPCADIIFGLREFPKERAIPLTFPSDLLAPGPPAIAAILTLKSPVLLLFF
jgi:hypothetical protein